MSFSLYLYQRLAEGNGYDRDLTKWAQNTWRRSTRAKGGYWTGGFVISGVSDLMLQDLYSTMIGKRVRETSYSIPTWEGEIVGLSLTLNGVTQEQSLDTEVWQNAAKVQYTYTTVSDTEQGALTYNPVANSFRDASQDFDDWDVAVGNANYEINVTNAGPVSVAQGYLGASFTTGAADDSVYIYKDIGRTTAGWNGVVGAGAPSTYELSHTTLAGTQQTYGFFTRQASIDIYGESQYIDSMAGQDDGNGAANLVWRRLFYNEYPHSESVGSLESSTRGEVTDVPNQLVVTCAGYVASINRRFHETDEGLEDISDQISTLVGESEFVTAGSILPNTLEVPMTGGSIPFRLWDQIEEWLSIIDSSAYNYVGGVYSGRVFNYDRAATEWLYVWKNGQLYSLTGQRMRGALIQPDIVVRIHPALTLIPPGGTAWRSILTTYVSEVEFVAPNSYRLIPESGDPMVGSY